jgi:hypothetical protein
VLGRTEHQSEKFIPHPGRLRCITLMLWFQRLAGEGQEDVIQSRSAQGDVEQKKLVGILPG